MAVLKGVNEIPEVIPCDAGDLSKTPTYITFPYDIEDEDDDDYEINFGEFAKNLAHENPKGTIFDLKRMLGRKFNDPRIQHDRKFWPFDIIEEKGEIKVMTGPNTSKYPSEIMAEYIKWLKQAADDYLGYRVDSAVVTVPVYFNQHQRELTTQACEQAGLRVLQFVNEPTAAAVAYSLPKISYNSNYTKNCLIFDLGGGTFDLAFLQVIGGQVHVKAIGGDDHLGGEDIDNNLVNYCLQQFHHKHGINLNQQDNKTVSDPVESMKISKRLRRLKNQCEQQKRNLSQAKRVIITLEKIYNDLDLSIVVTREIFDDINMGLFNRCIKVLGRFLENHNIAKRGIDDVVIVGGSSKIPCIQKMLSDFFGGKALCKTVDPDKAVALGASSLAFYAENVEVPNILLQDSVSISPPISTSGGNETQNQNQGSSRWGPTNLVRQHSEKPTVALRPDHQAQISSVRRNVSMFETKSPQSIPIKFRTDNLQDQSQPRKQFHTAAVSQNPVFTPIPLKPHGRLSEYLEPIQFQPINPSIIGPVKKPDIGIYINWNIFQIGSCKEPTAQSFTELITITPELYFGEKEVLIGAKAHAFIDTIHSSPMNERFFNIFELINSPEIKTHRLNIQGNTFTLCTAHVISAFFLQVFNLLNICGDGKIVVTLPFNKTYSGVEKIRKSLNILGYFNIRILPSLITTAIASLDTLDYYRNVESEPSFRKYIFVLDIQMDSFSMAILQMLPRGISVISSRRSENTAECQHEGFAQCHANWFKGTEIPQEWKEYIQNVYELLIDPFLAVSLKFRVKAKIDAIIINESKGSPSFVNMVKEVLRAKFYNLGIPQIEAKSLFGASLLVSPNLGAVVATRAVQILDPNMQVDVKGLYTKSHVLTTNIEGKVAKIENFTSQQFKISTEVTSNKSKKKMEESTNKYVLLQETNNQFDRDNKASDAGYYECRVEGKRRKRLFSFSNPHISFEIICKEDLDGFFSLIVVKKSDPNFEILLTKKENIICSSVCVSPAASEFGRLIAFYERLANRKNRKTTL